ncbi:MAG: carbon monoxide dehydrogenase subunit G, partial [Rhodospirillales bacterium]|nr:carbon monoxide dehydrogenase subunit G [Rhodospirillales bacterium]
MDMVGEYRINAPRQTVWEALNDPDTLKACIPGCEELVKESETDFSAKITAKVGAIRAKFGGKVTLSDLDPPNSYRIAGEGQGGVAGFAKGSAVVSLTEDGGATVLRYEAKADIGGKLASVGSRVIQGVGKKMADDFFGVFAERVGGSAATVTPEPSATEETPTPEGSKGTSPLVW